MFWPKKMSKVNIITLQGYKQDLVDELHEAGIMEIDETSEKIKDFSDYLKNGQPPKEETKYRKYDNKAREIIEILEKGEKEEESIKDKIKSKLTKKETEVPKKSLRKKDFEKIDELHQKCESKREDIEEIKSELNKLKDLRKKLEPYSSLKVPLNHIKKGKYVSIFLGNSSLKEAKEIKKKLEEKETQNWMDIKKESKEKCLFVIAYLNEEVEEVQRILRKSKSELFTNETELTEIPEREISKIEDEINSLREKKLEIKSSIGDLRRKHYNKIFQIKKTIRNEIEKREINKKFAESNAITLIEGWMPTKEENNLKTIVSKVTDNVSILETKEADKEENPPIELDNPSYLRGFEQLTRTFGLPRYNEIDPTPILALFLPLFFGVMFGDLGHGLIVFLVGLSLYKISDGIVNDFSKIIMPCGFFSMIFGFLYGEFMGLNLKEQSEMLGFSIPHQHPLHISPLHSPKAFLMIAISFGVLHLGIGLLLDLVNKIRSEEYKSVVEPLSQMWIFFGAIYIIIVSIQEFGTKIMEWNKPLILAILLPPVLLLTLSQVIEEWGELESPKDILSQIGEGGFESFHSILSFLSNTISYSRLFALALVHIGLFIALGEISEVLAKMLGFSVLDTIIWFFIYAVGTILILALDGLIVFLHSLRLHYYELFDKFFNRGSRSFNPFKLR